MKTREEIERRLRKLRIRYANKHVRRSQERRPHNCSFNEEHLPGKLTRPGVPVETEIAPRRQVTLVILNDPKPVRLCMYQFTPGGGTGWSGVVCDDDETAERCPYFVPSKGVPDARAEFMASLEDDEHVFDNYRDVATLQWVIGERVHSMPLSWWERLWLSFVAVFIRVARPSKALPPVKVPDDLWDDQNDPSSPA